MTKEFLKWINKVTEAIDGICISCPHGDVRYCKIAEIVKKKQNPALFFCPWCGGYPIAEMPHPILGTKIKYHGGLIHYWYYGIEYIARCDCKAGQTYENHPLKKFDDNLCYQAREKKTIKQKESKEKENENEKS